MELVRILCLEILLLWELTHFLSSSMRKCLPQQSKYHKRAFMICIHPLVAPLVLNSIGEKPLLLILQVLSLLILITETVVTSPSARHSILILLVLLHLLTTRQFHFHHHPTIVQTPQEDLLPLDTAHTLLLIPQDTTLPHLPNFQPRLVIFHPLQRIIQIKVNPLPHLVI